MVSFLERNDSLICLKCGLEFNITYQTIFRKWRRKIKFCPYCGHAIGQPAENSPMEPEDTEG